MNKNKLELWGTLFNKSMIFNITKKEYKNNFINEQKKLLIYPFIAILMYKIVDFILILDFNNLLSFNFNFNLLLAWIIMLIIWIIVLIIAMYLMWLIANIISYYLLIDLLYYIFMKNNIKKWGYWWWINKNQEKYISYIIYWLTCFIGSIFIIIFFKEL